MVEPIAIRVVWLLLRIAPGTTPNMVTAASVLCAGTSAVLFFRGEYIWAALIFEFSYVLDNADGILARYTNRVSRLGAAFDGLANSTAYGLNLGALVLGIDDDRLAQWLGVSLYLVWGLHYELGRHFEKPEKTVWANFVPSQGSFLRSKRLLYPLSFPDRQFILFFIGPLTGMIVLCALFVLLVELTSIVMKFRRLVRGNGNGS